MKHPRAVATALLIASLSAACAHAQAAAPFPVVNTAPPPSPSHALSNSCLAAGIVLIGSSFLFEHQADQNYNAYLAAIDPGEISILYDRTITDDRLSAAALIGGNLLVATGLYLRFVHPAASQRVSLVLGPQRCAVTCVF